jgi:S-methylmethionine-dependent homocysteine/selenocysteine methylase
MPQISALADTNVALLMAWTMTSATEAAGIAQAASDAGLPTVVSPTVETDGTLPDGTTLSEFVSRVDEATHGYPLFYMVNCAHPTLKGRARQRRTVALQVPRVPRQCLQQEP